EGDAGKVEGPAPVTVRQVLDSYLKHIHKTKKAATVEIRVRAYEPFVNHQPVDARGEPVGTLLGEKPIAALTHQDVYSFLEHMETVPRKHRRKKEQKGRKPVTWGPGSQRNFLQGVLAALNWAVKSRMIPNNPLDGIEKPGAASRGAEALLGT